MKAFKFLTVFALSGALFMACKKSDDPTPTPTTAEKIRATWNFNKLINNYSAFGTSGTDTTYGMPGDFVDFRSDNKVYSLMAGERDTVSYAVLNDTTLLIDLSPFKIKTLTNNNLELYSKYEDAVDTTEVKVYLSK